MQRVLGGGCWDEEREEDEQTGLKRLPYTLLSSHYHMLSVYSSTVGS